MKLAEISTPALCVDLPVLQRNIRTMAEFFAGVSCGLRPHFKAHKTPAIARMQHEAGCVGFTCATVGEAEVLAAHGFADLLIANEVVDPSKADRLADLAARCRLTVAVDSEAGIEVLRGLPVEALVDVNVGLPRCGVPPDQVLATARNVVDAGIVLRGVMGYEGHAVGVADRGKREHMARKSMTQLTDAARNLRDAGLSCDVVSAGGTGTYDITGRIDGVTEVQAGSYALMDTAYGELGLPFELALRCLCTVVSAHGDLAVLDGGLKALAVDHGNPSLPSDVGADVLFLSDEHTTLSSAAGLGLKAGERMWLLPSHIDPTVNLHDRLYAVDGEEVVDVWNVEARGYDRS